MTWRILVSMISYGVIMYTMLYCGTSTGKAHSGTIQTSNAVLFWAPS